MHIAVGAVTLLVYLPQVISDCPDSWTHLPTLRVCVRFETDELSWHQARDRCQQRGGDLVQIASLTKEFRVSEVSPDKKPNTEFWVGMSTTPGISVFSDPTEKVQVIAHGWTRIFCVLVNLVEHTWSSATCKSLAHSICERFEEKSDLVLGGSICTDDYCTCRKRDWLHSPENEKYFIINKVSQTYSNATRLCKKLGGELLVITSITTQQALKLMNVRWEDEGSFYWMGLTRKRNTKWQWSNGISMTSKAYNNWLPSSYITGNCGGIEWDYMAMWRAAPCTGLKYHICEAAVPCSSRPVISVDDGAWLDNHYITRYNDLPVNINCSLQGYPNAVTKVMLNCAGVWKGTEYVKRNISVVQGITFRMHRKKCLCQTILENGERNQAVVMFLYQGRPRFVRESDNNRVIPRKTLEDLTVRAFVFSNPKMTNHTITHNESAIHNRRFQLGMKTDMKSMVTIVTIIIKRLAISDSGRYEMIITNGPRKPLTYVFKLVVKPAPKIDEDKIWLRNVIVGVCLLVYFLFRLIALIPGILTLKNTFTAYILLEDLEDGSEIKVSAERDGFEQYDVNDND